jgi:hypothetical protein
LRPYPSPIVCDFAGSYNKDRQFLKSDPIQSCNDELSIINDSSMPLVQRARALPHEGGLVRRTTAIQERIREG